MWEQRTPNARAIQSARLGESWASTKMCCRDAKCSGHKLWIVHTASGVEKAGRDVFELQIRKLLDNLSRRHSGGEQLQYVDDTNAGVANTGAAAADTRIDGDAVGR